MSTLEARLAARRPRRARWWDLNSKLDQVAFDRAAAGARELERLRPGSVSSLNETTLDIGDGGTCAVGQTYGRFSTAYAPAHLINRGIAYGFTKGRFVSFDRLTRMWRRVVFAYRAAPTI